MKIKNREKFCYHAGTVCMFLSLLLMVVLPSRIESVFAAWMSYLSLSFFVMGAVFIIIAVVLSVCRLYDSKSDTDGLI